MYLLKNVTFIAAEFVAKLQFEGELIRKPHYMAHEIPKRSE
jgi:hypothetical protein